MNRSHVLFELKETHEALSQLIAALQQDADFDETVFEVDVRHLYHHINTAWNARRVSDHQLRDVSEEDYMRWRQFPLDLDMSV